MTEGRTEFDTGEIFRLHGQEYENKYPMHSEQRKALRAIASCRTSVLGGHIEKCSNCGFQQPVYNSCRNNNCPKCQGIKRRQWVEERLKELLPVSYFHVIFTIPNTFNILFNSYYRKLNDALFRASSATLLHFFRKLGGEPAMMSILHTWGQTMCLHPHVHILATGGCLSFDRKNWIKIGNNYLFNVKKLSAEFKKRFIKEIEKHIPEFEIPEESKEKDWVVNCRKPFAGAAKVVEYLGRYTYRSVISNRRILNFSDNKVAIDYKDYKDTDADNVPKHKNMTISAIEYIRRFIQHIPPLNFRRIRFYGILAGSERKTKLRTARDLLVFEEFQEERQTETETDSCNLCSQCENGSMEVIETLLPHGPPFIIFLNERKRAQYAA